ncbi:hypothetical protein GOC80_13280 [Sinorhizobium medicae]|nr:hypothetical protein [Sinorhizobium medicae]
MNKALRKHLKSTIGASIAPAQFRQNPRTHRHLWEAMADYRRLSEAAFEAGRKNKPQLRYEIAEMAVECAMNLPSFASGMGLSRTQARQALKRLGVTLDGAAANKSFTSEVAENPRDMDKENVTMTNAMAKINTRQNVKTNVLAAVELLHERHGQPPSITAVQKLTGHSYTSVRKHYPVVTAQSSEQGKTEVLLEEPAVGVSEKVTSAVVKTVNPHELHLQLTTSAFHATPMTLKVDLSRAPEHMSAIKISFMPG